MSEERYQRVVISMDPAADPTVSLNIASELAAVIQAELRGLFIEDTALADVSALPFTRVIHAGAQTSSGYTVDDMQHAVRRQADMFERALSDYAGSAHLSWGVDSSKGEFIGEVLSRTETGDILVFQGAPTGLTALDIIKDAKSCAVHACALALCLSSRGETNAPVIAIDDGDAAGEETIKLARQISLSKGVPILLYVLADDVERAEEITRRDVELLGTHPSLSISTFIGWSTEHIVNSLADTPASYVVADLQGAPFEDNQSASLLCRAARAPVILVKPEG